MRKALAVVPVSAAAAALLLAGCSSSGKQAQTLTPTAPSSSSSAGSAGGISSELLAVTQLPTGWSSTSPSSSSGSATASCAALNNRPWQTLPERAEADFQQSANGPFLAEKLDAGSAAEVSQAWTAFGTATSECRSFTGSDGTQTTLSALSFPKYGDATYAFALTATADGESVAGDVVVVRKDNTMIQIITAGLGDGVPISTVEQATTAAVAKVQ